MRSLRTARRLGSYPLACVPNRKGTRNALPTYINITITNVRSNLHTLNNSKHWTLTHWCLVSLWSHDAPRLRARDARLSR